MDKGEIKMIVDYIITRIIQEGKPQIDFKRGLILADVEFEAISQYSGVRRTIKITTDTREWKENKKKMTISL